MDVAEPAGTEEDRDAPNDDEAEPNVDEFRVQTEIIILKKKLIYYQY